MGERMYVVCWLRALLPRMCIHVIHMFADEGVESYKSIFHEEY